MYIMHNVITLDVQCIVRYQIYQTYEVRSLIYNVEYAKVPPDQLELDTTIDWFKYLDDESTGVYDFGDKCLKKHRAVGSIRYSRISFKSCAWKRNFY